MAQPSQEDVTSPRGRRRGNRGLVLKPRLEGDTQQKDKPTVVTTDDGSKDLSTGNVTLKSPVSDGSAGRKVKSKVELISK